MDVLLKLRAALLQRNREGARQQTVETSPTARPSRSQKLLGVERLLLAPQVKHRAADLRFEDGERFALAALLLLPRQPRLHRRARPQHQARRLAEGPRQVRVADLLPTEPLHLAGARVLAPH